MVDRRRKKITVHDLPKIAWSPARPEPELSPGVWEELEAEQLRQYIDWHRRHPHCISPRKLKIDMDDMTDNAIIDEEDPSKYYTSNGMRVLPVSEKFLPSQLGKLGTFCTVVEATATLEYEQKQLALTTTYYDPWFEMSVKDQLEQYHIDGSHTTVKLHQQLLPESRQNDEIQNSLVVTDIENDPHPPPSNESRKRFQKIDFHDFEGGSPNYTKIIQENPKIGKQLENLLQNDPPFHRKQKVGPFEDKFKFSKYTRDGTHLASYQSDQLNGRLSAALLLYQTDKPSPVTGKSQRSPKSRSVRSIRVSSAMQSQPPSMTAETKSPPWDLDDRDGKDSFANLDDQSLTNRLVQSNASRSEELQPRDRDSSTAAFEPESMDMVQRRKEPTVDTESVWMDWIKSMFSQRNSPNKKLLAMDGIDEQSRFRYRDGDSGNQSLSTALDDSYRPFGQGGGGGMDGSVYSAITLNVDHRPGKDRDQVLVSSNETNMIVTMNDLQSQGSASKTVDLYPSVDNQTAPSHSTNQPVVRKTAKTSHSMGKVVPFPNPTDSGSQSSNVSNVTLLNKFEGESKVDPVDQIVEKLGGRQGLDGVANKIQGLAKEVTQKSVKKGGSSMVQDLSMGGGSDLDLLEEACSMLQVVKVRILLTTATASSIDPSMKSQQDVPIFLQTFRTAIAMDSDSGNGHFEGDLHRLFEPESDQSEVLQQQPFRNVLKSFKTSNDYKYEGDRQKVQKILNLLVDHGADVDAVDDGLGRDGYAAAHLAAKNDNEKMIHWLVVSGKTTFRTLSKREKYSALMFTAKYGHVRSAALIIHSGFPVDFHNEWTDGNTALHVAAQFGQSRFAQFLLGVGADKKRVNSMGCRAADVAANNGYLNTAQVIASFAVISYVPRHHLDYLKRKEGVVAVPSRRASGILDHFVNFIEKGEEMIESVKKGMLSKRNDGKYVRRVLAMVMAWTSRRNARRKVEAVEVDEDDDVS